MALPPKTKGELGLVSEKQTIRGTRPPLGTPEISFSWTPLSTPVTYTANGNTYPRAANEPVVGAPDQADVRLTTAYTEITFTAEVRVPEGDFITEYEWDFGDGFKAHGPVVRHTYNTGSPSTRTVLCVTDNHGRRFCRGRYMNLRPAQATVLMMGITVEDA